jgi:thiol-disulfide isomerase/thioredoxin
VIIETGEINVEIDKDTIQNTKVTGTYNNDELTSFNKNMKPMQKKMQEFQKVNMQAYQQAAQTKDTVTLNKINKESEVIQKEFKNFFQKYADSHPKSLLSLYMIQTMFRNPDFDLAKTKKMFNALDKDLQNTSIGKKIKEQFDQLSGKPTSTTAATDAKPTVGNVAPDFSATTPDGKKVSLKESLGKVTLIDFWASWCGPCRQENPNVLAAYNKYHDKGFNIIGISLDDNGDKWKEAIAKDKLSWTQVSNLKKWADPIALMYKIEQIPSSFLLDSSGKIVATDLRGEELNAKIESLLK